eukprot:4514869-Alexandrium_andersonii.AAC.1
MCIRDRTDTAAELRVTCRWRGGSRGECCNRRGSTPRPAPQQGCGYVELATRPGRGETDAAARLR